MDALVTPETHFIARKPPLCQRVVFFYAPLILGGRQAPTAVAGDGARSPAGKLRLRIDRTYPLADAAAAHRDLESRKTAGKLLLVIG